MQWTTIGSKGGSSEFRTLKTGVREHPARSAMHLTPWGCLTSYLVQTFKSMLMTDWYFCTFFLTLSLPLFLQRRFSSIVFNFLHPLPFFLPFLFFFLLFFFSGRSLRSTPSSCWGKKGFTFSSFVSLTVVFRSNLQILPRDEGILYRISTLI